MNTTLDRLNTHIKNPRECGCKSYIGNYLILINKVNSKGTVRYRIVTHGGCGVSNWGIRLIVSWCVEALIYAAWQISTLTERLTGSSKAGRRDRQLVRTTRKGSHVETMNCAQLELFDYPQRGFLRAVFLNYKAKTEHGPHCSQVRKINFTAN